MSTENSSEQDALNVPESTIDYQFESQESVNMDNEEDSNNLENDFNIPQIKEMPVPKVIVRHVEENDH